MATQQPEKPAIPSLSTRVNLDEVFGYLHQNIISDVVTPYRLVLNELIQLVEELDTRDDSLSREDIIVIYSVILGLIKHEDMSYLDVLRCVRHANRSIQPGLNLYNQFKDRMERKLKGESNKVIYPNEAPGSSNRRPVEDDETRFMYKSPIHLFRQKLYVAGNSITQQQTFEMHQKLKEYISGTWPIKLSGKPLPFDINTSLKAREWIRKQMHLLQLCPTEADTESLMLFYCDKIIKYHPDIPDVYLLLTIYHLIQKDHFKAHDCLRTFSDLSVFKPFTGWTYEEQARMHNPALFPDVEIPCRMGLPDQRPFRYGPLMSARIYKLAGERKMAHLLLLEANKEAQAASDQRCAKLVRLELTLLRSLGPVESTNPEPLDPIEHKSTHFIWDFTRTEHGIEMEDREFEESPVHAQTLMYHQSRLDSLLNRFRKGQFINNEFGYEPIDMTALDDIEAKCRELRDAYTAALQTYRFFQGFAVQAKSTAEASLSSNGKDGIASHHETEAYAIMEVNLTYQKCLDGEWKEAIANINNLERKFPVRINPKAGKHVQIAKNCINFNNSFRLGKIDECEDPLVGLNTYSYEEWFLRKTLILAVKGSLPEAVEMLEKEHLRLQCRTYQDIYAIRVACQYAIADMALSQTEPRVQMLQEILERLERYGKYTLYNLVSKKIACLRLMAGDFQGALNSIRGFVKQNPLDDGIFYLIRGSAILGLKDPARIHQAIDSFQEAQDNLLKAGYHVIAKHAVVRLYHLLPSARDAKLQQFTFLNEEYPGRIDWYFL